MIDRYTLAEMGELFSVRARLQRWVDVEMLVVEAWADLGRIPRGAADRILAAVPVVDQHFVAAVAERELTTRHDVAAFVDVLSGVGDDARWIHYRVTSSDIVDTALSVSLGRAADLVLDAACDLVRVLSEQARRYRHLRMVGRTHGVHAEPITLGGKLALLALQLSRAAEGVAAAAAAIRVGKISGAVGTFSLVDPQVEVYVCQVLGLRRIAASQVIPRDLHAAFVFSLARTLASVEAVAMQIRLGHQTEVAEIREGFSVGQKGSSAMPHKANPATAEQICGLARLARSSIAPMLEDVALWHERDLTHSSVERVVLPDMCSVTHYALRMAEQLCSRWVVDENRIQVNLKSSQDLICSQSLLHALIDSGRSRDEAYRLTQSAALSAKEHGTTLFEQAMSLNLGLTDGALATALDITVLLTHADRAVDELDDCWAERRVM